MIQPIFHPANILDSRSVLFHMKQCSWETNCVRFAGGCVVRIGYESFSDFGFSEFFLFLEW